MRRRIAAARSISWPSASWCSSSIQSCAGGVGSTNAGGASAFAAGSAETLPEGSGEESGLSVEAGVCGVIPDEVVGLGDLRREVHLGGDDLVGNVGRELAILQEARALGGGGASHNDHGIKMNLRPGFVKQRNI